MDSEEKLKYYDEIMETIDCYNNIEDEVIKLVCLLIKCRSNFIYQGEELLIRKYVLEKATRILEKIPIILDTEAKQMFVSIKMRQKENVTLKEEHQ